MKKRILVLVLLAGLFFQGSVYGVTGNSGSANEGFGYYITSTSYSSDSGQLNVEGFFVNSTKNSVTKVKTLRLTINGRDGFVVAQAVSGGGLDRLNMKPGGYKPWKFTLAKPNKGKDLSRIDYNIDCDIETGPALKLPDGINVFYKDSLIAYDVRPSVINGRTLIPARLTFEKMGAKVLWNESGKTVTVQRGDKSIEIQNGKNQMRVNGTPVRLDVPAQIIEGRMLIPLRAIATALECIINWGDRDKIVVIVEPE